MPAVQLLDNFAIVERLRQLAGSGLVKRHGRRTVEPGEQPEDWPGFARTRPDLERTS